MVRTIRRGPPRVGIVLITHARANARLAAYIDVFALRLKIEIVNFVSRQQQLKIAEKETLSASRVNALLASIPGPTRAYLEIGIQGGATLTGVASPRKVGVDPRPHFRVPTATPALEICRMSSNDFFARNRECFGIAFNDGHRTCEQFLADVVQAAKPPCAALALIIDGVIPSDEWSSVSNKWNAFRLRRLATGKLDDFSWHSDIWKLLITLKHFLPDTEVCIVNEPRHAQAIIFRPDLIEYCRLLESDVTEFMQNLDFNRDFDHYAQSERYFSIDKAAAYLRELV
jgi:hypothetical protein